MGELSLESLERKLWLLDERVKTLEAVDKEQQDMISLLRREVREAHLRIETGQPHKYCGVCWAFVRIDNGRYVGHPMRGNNGQCENSGRAAAV